MKSPFRGYTAILYKEFLVVLRDPLTLFFMFVPPLIQLIAFGFALDTDVKNLSLVVLDEDRTVESRQIVERFVNTGTFKLKGEVASPEELSRAVRQGKAYVGIDIPPNFTRDLHAGRTARIQVIIDGSNSTIASSALNTSIGITFRESILQLLAKTGGSDVPVEVRPQILYNPAMRSPNFFVPGVIGLVLQIATVFATAMSLVRERERGTLEQLLVSPLSRWGLMLGKLTPYLFISVTMGVGPLRGDALGFPRAHRGIHQRTDGVGRLLCVRTAEPGPADFHAGAKSNAGVANVHAVHFAVRVFLRIHFPARNDAGDFLRHQHLPAGDVFH